MILSLETQGTLSNLRFPMAVSMKITVVWDVTPCSLYTSISSVHRRFEEPAVSFFSTETEDSPFFWNIDTDPPRLPERHIPEDSNLQNTLTST
jgi:hypothetical protein